MFSFLKNRKEKIAAGKAIDTAEAIIDCFSTILSLSSDQKSMLKEFTYPFMKKVVCFLAENSHRQFMKIS